jgi:glutamyl-Q tRNA(Asp) synthetase
VWQSTRGELYTKALQSLRDQLRVYRCGCSRRDIELAWEATGQVRMRHGELVYPGTCRHGLKGKHARAWRLRCTNDDDSDLQLAWFDRRLGAQTQNVTQTIGDIVLQRTDGLWAYQMAVVVDDADQGVTHVVRGGDMTESTPRQIHLQRALGVATPHYLHTPVVMAADGEKLSKQNGAAAIDVSQPLAALREAGAVLGVSASGTTVADWLASAVQAWAALYPPTSCGSS